MRSRTRRLKSFWVVIARSFVGAADDGLTLPRTPPRRGAAKHPGDWIPFASPCRRREHRSRGRARDTPTPNLALLVVHGNPDQPRVPHAWVPSGTATAWRSGRVSTLASQIAHAG